MREYELIIDEALKNGLSPERLAQPNAQVLETFLGFRCGGLGAETYTAGNNPITAIVDMHYTFPFPQILEGSGRRFLVVRTSPTGTDYIYLLSSEMDAVALIGSSHLEGQYEIADFGEYCLITNGGTMFYYNTATSAWVTTGALTVIPMMRTVCNFNNQIVGGGVKSDWYDCDEKYYLWSRIKEIDFTPSEGGEADYVRCPFGGDVCNVRSMNSAVIGYSTEGVVAISPVSSPLPTFGVHKLDNVGIVNQGAVDGNFKRQLYVGKDKTLRMVNEKGVENLNYQHHIELLGDDEDIIVRYDEGLGDFYVGNSEKTFLLSPNGLSEIPQHPTAVWRTIAARPHMLPEEVSSYEPTIVTNAFNMSYGGRKCIETVETDLFPMYSSTAKVTFTSDGITWYDTELSNINDEGIAFVRADGTTFKFTIKADSVDERGVMSYIRTRFKMTDLRGIRGVYAPPPRGQ